VSSTKSGIVKVIEITGASSGPLSGLQFAAKDLFDIEGYVTGAGNPDWAKTHPPAKKTAPAVQMLIDAGATLVGKTLTDELAYSIDGINVHYGTPLNPQYNDRIPGGSSSGSAAIVAHKLVDFAIGTDTGGSIRTPANHCGIYGFRPTHNRVSVENTVPLAPSFDTVGWFARDPNILKKCGSLFLNEIDSPNRPMELLVAADAIDALEPKLQPAILSTIEKIKPYFPVVGHVELAKLGWEHYLTNYRIIQGYEAWKTHGEWIKANKPTFAKTIQERFDIAEKITEEEYLEACAFRKNIIANFEDLLSPETVLCMPTTWNLPPLKTASEIELQNNRTQSMKFSCIAPLAGIPEVTIPVKYSGDKSIGFSLLAKKGEDMLLLDVCQDLTLLLG